MKFTSRNGLNSITVDGSCCPNRCIQIWIHLNLAVRTWYECQRYNRTPQLWGGKVCHIKRDLIFLARSAPLYFYWVFSKTNKVLIFNKIILIPCSVTAICSSIFLWSCNEVLVFHNFVENSLNFFGKFRKSHVALLLSSFHNFVG